jgi:hypothetical protein
VKVLKFNNYQPEEIAMTAFNNIDANRIASAKQIWAVANRFASLCTAVSSERYGLTKVYNAILNSLHGEAKLTHGDIQSYFECETVPKHIQSRIKSKSAPKPKAKKTSKKSKPEPEIVDFVERTSKPAKPVKKTTENSVAKAMNARIDSMESRFDSLESKVGDIEAGLAMILEAVQQK